MSTSPYDVTVKNSAGTTFGYVIDWENERPLTKSSKPAEIGSAVQIADQNSRYNVRDANDYLRMDIYDWAEGAGQKSYDTPGANAAKFYDSRNVDISERGELRLGPGVTACTVPITGETAAIIGSKCISALGYCFAAFDPAGSDPRLTIRYSQTNATGWVGVDLDGSGADPVGSVTAFATDGQYAYAALSGADGDGSVWKGIASATEDWTSLNADAANRNVVALAYCGGTLYGAKGSGSAATQVGYFNSSGIWTEITGMTFAYQTPVALATLGNYAYMVTYAGGVSKVYTVQHNDGAGTNVVIDLATFPTGFRATCAYGYLGNLYVGGYYETATASVGIGAIYLINGNSMALLTTIGEDATEDWRIMSITGHMKHLYFLANNSVYKWSLELGGYHHYFDVSTPGAGFTWTVTEAMTSEPTTPTWTKTTSTAAPTVACASGTLTATLAASEWAQYVDGASLSASTGHCAEITFGTAIAAGGTTDQAGPMSAISSSDSELLDLYLDDGNGSYRTRLAIFVKKDTAWPYYQKVRFGMYGTIGWTYTSYVDAESLCAKTLRVSSKSGLASLYLDDSPLLTSVALGAAAANQVVLLIHGRSATQSIIKIDQLRYSAAGDNPNDAATGVATMCHAANAVWVAIENTAIYKSNTSYQTSGYLQASDAAARMAGVDKWYRAVDVVHDSMAALSESATISVDTWVDGAYGGDDAGATIADNDDALTLHTCDVNVQGTSFRSRVNLAGSGSETPVVRSLVTRFLPEATPTLWTFIFRCVNGVPMHNGREWDYDAWDAIAHLYNAVNSVCTVDTLYGDSITGHIESVDFLASYPSKAVGQGLVQVTLRVLS